MNRLFLLFLLVCITIPINLQSEVYFGMGGSYLLPQGKLKDYNDNSLGVKIELMNKNYCKLWYGLRVDYFSLNKKADAYPAFETIAMLSPVVKYAPFVTDCYTNKLIPYIQGKFDISSISGQDELSKLGLGASLGLGLAYNFRLFSHCWMLEAEALYSAPNTIYRDEDRTNLKSMNVGLSLSVGL